MQKEYPSYENQPERISLSMAVYAEKELGRLRDPSENGLGGILET
jgi:hypothetical protein